MARTPMAASRRGASRAPELTRGRPAAVTAKARNGGAVAPSAREPSAARRAADDPAPPQRAKPAARQKRVVSRAADAGQVAARVVHQAASILEEELARGILAAQEVEARFIDVSALRSEDPAHVMQRFRRDAHELVDILIDLVHVSVRTVGRAITVDAGSRGQLETRNGVREVVAIDLPGPVAPGQSTELSLTLTNSDAEDTPPFTFTTLGLLSPTGGEIRPENLSFSPRELVIEPNGEASLKVRLTVPNGLPDGRYSGLLQSTHLARLCATIGVDVVNP